MSKSIVWFRHDLRIDDHLALARAAKRGAVIPLYIFAPDEEGDWPPGAATRWWLHHSLSGLHTQLTELGAPLIIRRGSSLDVLRSVIEETGADAVYWSRRYEPAAIARDMDIKTALKELGVAASSTNSASLFEPWTIQSQGGTPYRVFTPYSRACLAAAPPGEPSTAPTRLDPVDGLTGIALDELELLPTIPWAVGIDAAWTPGESGAQEQLQRLIDDVAAGYIDGRNRPDRPGTSRLSPHLHFGEISPRRVWHTVRARQESWPPQKRASAEAFLRQLLWREFSIHLLYHCPTTPQEPLRDPFRRFPWLHNPASLHAWQRGETGYPLVDAGMRELWTTGWMHNRVRMVVGSFLVKHLLLPWQDGAEWFWDTLVDADLANNTMGWQWIAGCGADAAPYFRVFNPTLQAEKFDPDGDYIRRWVPELTQLPTRALVSPWTAKPIDLKAANVTLGTTYPEPIVDHAFARARALSAYAKISGKS